ncbi:MAG: hypothetical protein C4567_05355 [Deltaproteobacteria bacterium]|nr:MAG: hypothetical protein C4567_05355 [Deltaproteobacteria bacterium]
MKRCFITAISLSLLLLLAGFGGAASLTTNILGKYEGNVQMVRGQSYMTTPMVIRILNQNGALFYATVAFPNIPDQGTSNINGVLYEGQVHFTGEYVTGAGRCTPSSPPYISGYFHSIAVYGSSEPAETGVFYLKRTSTNPTAP